MTYFRKLFPLLADVMWKPVGSSGMYRSLCDLEFLGYAWCILQLLHLVLAGGVCLYYPVVIYRVSLYRWIWNHRSVDVDGVTYMAKIRSV